MDVKQCHHCILSFDYIIVCLTSDPFKNEENGALEQEAFWLYIQWHGEVGTSQQNTENEGPPTSAPSNNCGG